MIFKCFKCDKNVMVGDVKPLINKADLTIEGCKALRSEVQGRQYKNGRVTIAAIPREESSVVMTNLSDGIKDGLVLFYMKNQKLHSVLITQEQADMLDISLKIAFGDEPVKIAPANDVKKYLYESEEE